MDSAKRKTYTVEDIYSLPEGQRAELIDGAIYDMSPPGTRHQRILSGMHAAIYQYIKQMRGACDVLPAPFAVFLNEDNRNYVEPDISVICDHNKLTDKGCNGAPDWVIEIVSPGSRRMDYFIKLFKYRTAGVREYWIVDPDKNRVTVYDLEHEDTNEYTFADKIQAGIFKDFVIDCSELKR